MSDCRQIANDLLHVLERLATKRKKSRWDSFAVAMREVWSQEKINEL